MFFTLIEVDKFSRLILENNVVLPEVPDSILECLLEKLYLSFEYRDLSVFKTISLVENGVIELDLSFVSLSNCVNFKELIDDLE